jgi:hypothetical protein
LAALRPAGFEAVKKSKTLQEGFVTEGRGWTP